MFYDSHLLFLASLIGCHAMYQAVRDNSFMMHYLYINNNHVLDEENKGLIERNYMERRKREREILNLENKKYNSNTVINYKTKAFDFLLNS